VSEAIQSPLAAKGDRFWAVVAASAALHVAGVAVLLLLRGAPVIDLEQKPIVAKLVRLGEKRPEQLLPRKEEPAPAAAEPTPVSSPSAAPAPAPNPAPAVAPKPKAAPPPQAARPGPRSDAFGAALARIRKEQATREPVYGDPGGDPLGDSSEGSPGDRYGALVRRAIQEVYRVPATISERDRLHLRASVVLFVDGDGGLIRWAFQSRSGNAAYDDALSRAVQQARLPPPPPELRREMRDVGLKVQFSI
jgi:colicin import membrane protein/protein TonB